MPPARPSHSSNLLNYFYLDARHSLMTGKMVHVLYNFFKLLDVHNCHSLNDLQFYHLMRHMTRLSRKQIYMVFDMLDTDGSGTLDFDEFYLLFCILVAQKDRAVKKFIHRHSRTVFDLLDRDGSNEVSVAEFAVCGFLFNFHNRAISKIFREFDLSGDEELDYREFRLFTMACIDKQQEIETARKSKFRSLQGSKELTGPDSMDVERRKSKVESMGAVKVRISPAESADARGETDPQGSCKRETDPRNAAAAKAPLDKSQRDLESGKGGDSPDKAEKNSEPGKTSPGKTSSGKN